MEEQKKMIKDDINFLEYPNWVIDRRGKTTTWIIEKPQGKYEIISPKGLPNHLDKIILYFFTHKLHHETKLESYALTTNRYEIAKNVFGGNHFGKNVYDRIMKAVKKWQSISICFEGLFYESEGYTVRGFSVIDEFVLKRDTGELTIKFSESYIRQLKETKFYKLIDFEQYRKLHRTISARLYEILIKNFKDRNVWVINIQALAEKMTCEKREGAQNYYPSDVLRYLKPSINEINKKTDLSISFQYNKETNVCIFKEVPKQKETFIAATRDVKQDKQPAKDNAKDIAKNMKKFKELSDGEQKAILHSISKDPFLKFIKDQATQIYAYMSRPEN